MLSGAIQGERCAAAESTAVLITWSRREGEVRVMRAVEASFPFMSSMLDNADRCWSTLVDIEEYLVNAG